MSYEPNDSASAIAPELFDTLPVPLREFLRASKHELRTERDDWDVEIKPPPGFLKKCLPAGAVLIANNGVGDHLFLVPDSISAGVLAQEVRAFWHEGHRIEVIAEAIGSLTNPPVPTVTKRPPVSYHDKLTPVQLGDEVTARFCFVRRPGRVVYVPGISLMNRDMERRGLCWVSIEFKSGVRAGMLVDPITACLQKGIRYVKRSAEPFNEMGPDERIE